MFRHRHTTLCPEGWCFLLLIGAILLLAIIRDENLMLIVAGMLIAPLGLNWYLARRNLRHVSVQRELAGDARAGGWLRVHLCVRNGRRRLGTWAVVVHDRFQPDKRIRGNLFRVAVPFSYIRGDQSRRQSYQIRLPERGRHRVGPLTVSTAFPFGFVRHTVTLAAEQELIVYPRLGRLSAQWQRSRVTVERGVRRAKQTGRAPGDMFAVREWQAGDSSRWIHWRKSARHGELIVKQFERQGDHQVAVLLDLWQPPGELGQRGEQIEQAVSCAATLVEQACRAGNRLLLGVAGEHVSWMAGRATMPYTREAERRLALAQAAAGDRRMELWEVARGELRFGTTVMLISTRPREADDQDRWNELMTKLSQQKGISDIRVLRTDEPDFAEVFQNGAHGIETKA